MLSSRWRRRGRKSRRTKRTKQPVVIYEYVAIALRSMHPSNESYTKSESFLLSFLFHWLSSCLRVVERILECGCVYVIGMSSIKFDKLKFTAINAMEIVNAIDFPNHNGERTGLRFFALTTIDCNFIVFLPVAWKISNECVHDIIN